MVARRIVVAAAATAAPVAAINRLVRNHAWRRSKCPDCLQTAAECYRNLEEDAGAGGWCRRRDDNLASSTRPLSPSPRATLSNANTDVHTYTLWSTVSDKRYTVVRVGKCEFSRLSGWFQFG